MIRDRQADRLPASSLTHFAAYALFFPAAAAGPIDRCQHFFSELNQAQSNQSEPGWRGKAAQDLGPGLFRVLIGAVKKFVIADSLALIALNTQNAVEIQKSGWAWAVLAAFSLRIYFDFSGYTDIALGTARLIGIRLPENFDHPYTRLNLTAFWNSWHITLAQWFRGYVFNPLTRSLRTRPHPLPMWLILLCGQLVTMSLIGLWHGISWNFLFWGLWHGGGLFVQNRWSEWLHSRTEPGERNSPAYVALKGLSWLATFTYVSLGWVWFVLPSTAASWNYMLKLFGAG